MNSSKKMHHLRYRADAAIGERGRRLIRFSQRNSNYLSHAKDEWAIAFPGDDEMQAKMGEHILDMVVMFGLEGHSGFRASYARQYIDKPLRFELIGRALFSTPVTHAHLVCRLLLEKTNNTTHT